MTAVDWTFPGRFSSYAGVSGVVILPATMIQPRRRAIRMQGIPALRNLIWFAHPWGELRAAGGLRISKLFAAPGGGDPSTGGTGERPGDWTGVISLMGMIAGGGYGWIRETRPETTGTGRWEKLRYHLPPGKGALKPGPAPVEHRRVAWWRGALTCPQGWRTFPGPVSCI